MLCLLTFKGVADWIIMRKQDMGIEPAKKKD